MVCVVIRAVVRQTDDFRVDLGIFAMATFFSGSGMPPALDSNASN